MFSASRRIVSGVVAALVVLVLAPAAPAQEDDGPAANIAQLVQVDVAAEDQMAFEDGMKQYIADIQELGGDWTWFAWQTVTGKHTGSYWFGTFGHSWADFDEQSLSDPQAARQSFTDNVAPYIQHDHTGFWQMMEGLSRLPAEAGEGMPPMLTDVVFYQVKFGEEDAFTNAIQQVKRVADEADHPDHWEAYRLRYGGGSVWALAAGADSWADLATPEPNLGQILEEATSEYEARTLWKQFTGTLSHMHAELLRFREDLSFVPGSDGSGM